MFSTQNADNTQWQKTTQVGPTSVCYLGSLGSYFGRKTYLDEMLLTAVLF